MWRAAIALAVAAAAVPSAAPAPARAAGWPMALPAAGYCVPAPDDATLVPRTVRALDVPATSTAPIAILDTGVDPSVPQLAGRVMPGVDALTGAPVDGDPDGHGTEAAGIAASAGPGLRGVSPSSSIFPVRIYDANRASSADSVAKGIAQAVQRGVGVIVISGSGPLDGAAPGDVLKVQKAIGDAFGHGILVVAAAGDDTQGVATLPGSLPHVLTAGSSTVQNTRSAASGTGPWLDVLAPADGIEGPLPPAVCVHGFGFSTGTSFAAPTLGAAAALVMAQRPGLTTQQYFELVRRAAIDLGPTGRDNDSGFGLLDVATGLSAPPLAKETSREVDDDPYWVRRAYAKAHPALLTRKKMRFKATGSVSAAKDPADVYPVSLIKGERMVVSVTATNPGSLLELSVLNPKAGDFDISNGVDKNRSVSTGGLSSEPQVELTASRTGMYYIAVEASDPVDPDDATVVPTDADPYQLSAYKQRKKARKKRR
jgi:hypothetical protein